MMLVRQTILDLSKIKIGNGRATSFWFDPWLKRGPLYTLLDSPISHCLEHPQFGNLISNGRWKLQLVKSIFDTQTYQHIADSQFSASSSEDCRFQPLIATARHSVASYYKALYDLLLPNVHPADGTKIPAKMWFHLWRMVHILAEKIAQWVSGLDPRCFICHAPQGSHIHVFIDCPFAATTWTKFLRQSPSMDYIHFLNTDWDQ